MFRVALTRVRADFNKRYEVSLNTFSVWQDEHHVSSRPNLSEEHGR